MSADSRAAHLLMTDRSCPSNAEKDAIPKLNLNAIAPNSKQHTENNDVEHVNTKQIDSPREPRRQVHEIILKP